VFLESTTVGTLTLLVYDDIPAAHAYRVEVFGLTPGPVETHDGETRARRGARARRARDLDAPAVRRLSGERDGQDVRLTPKAREQLGLAHSRFRVPDVPFRQRSWLGGRSGPTGPFSGDDPRVRSDLVGNLDDPAQLDPGLIPPAAAGRHCQEGEKHTLELGHGFQFDTWTGRDRDANTAPWTEATADEEPFQARPKGSAFSRR